jgi:poly(3-hydroxybutyrate) depolymerase
MSTSFRRGCAMGLFVICIAAGCGSDDGDDVTSALGTGGTLGGTGGTPALMGSGGKPNTMGVAGMGSGGSNGSVVPNNGTGGSTGGAATGGTGGVMMGSGGATAGSGGTTAGTGGSSGGGNTGEPCTGKPGKTGDDTRVWDKEGAAYIVHFPPGLDANTPVPLVIVAHGFTMSGAVMQALTGFDSVSDANKFVVVYPDGDGGATPWNVGDGTCLPGAVVDAPAADSFGYLMAIKASVEQDQCINSKQVFVTGFSMGGYFSNNVGCQLGNTFARAVGPHSGGTYSGDCPGAPVPIFIMHGDADTFIDYTACGMGARDLWLQRNKCGTEFETKMVDGGKCDWYKNCDPNGQTVFCSFFGIGHNWAPGATNAVWDFFKMYL